MMTADEVDRTLTLLVGMLTLVLMTLGLLSAAWGRVAAWRDARADEPEVTSSAPAPEPAPGTRTTTPYQAPEVVRADTDAADAGTAPRTGTAVSRRMSDVDIIALLSVQRGADGKHRFSANEIAALMGGTRADVLAQVRALRSVAEPAAYRPLDADRRPLGTAPPEPATP